MEIKEQDKNPENCDGQMLVKVENLQTKPVNYAFLIIS